MTTNELLSGERKINRLGFGAMRLPAQLHPGTWDGPARDPQIGIAVLRRAVELGVNHIDTAGFYERGGVHAHDLIREALYPYPDDLLIATKVGPMVDASGLPAYEAGPAELRGLVEEDLRRLGVNRLELVYLRVGGMRQPGGEPIADRFAALAALRDEGLIRHLGLSNVDQQQIAAASAIAPVTAVQNHFHVHHRDDRQTLTRCEQLGIAYVPFFPLGGAYPPLDEARLKPVADHHHATVPQIALAWLLATSPVTMLIPGTGSLRHLEENVAAAGIRLTDEDLTELISEG